MVLTLGLVWMFWLTPAKSERLNTAMLESKQYEWVPPPRGAQEFPSPDKSVKKRPAEPSTKAAKPAAPAPYDKSKDYGSGGTAAVYEHKVSWLDTAGKVSPLVSTGITVATFMRGRKRKKR